MFDLVCGAASRLGSSNLEIPDLLNDLVDPKYSIDTSMDKPQKAKISGGVGHSRNQ